MATMHVSLSRPLEEWVQSRVDGGAYATADDYVRDLIMRDRRVASGQEDRLKEFDRMIFEGLADLEAGRVHDADEVFEDALAVIAAIERQKAMG